MASPRVRRRRPLAMVGGSLLVSTALVYAYFVLPLTSDVAADTFVQLVVGLVVLAALLAWQIREILRSPYPAAQAISALVMSVPLFLTLFSVTYYLMGESAPSAFSEPMTRLDSMYFTVTVFATVGFGDITAVSQTARAVTTVQMMGGLVLVGLIARVIFGAVQEGRSRRDERHRPGADR
ncbi:potassium channel family protein [Nocardioides koreensis]|uniref:potassium channel family protein n=1 Tax=Nocardioides koreensis TaxID=433651 RepID=UPI0031E4027A